ncbi:MAG: hypothetical protein ACI4X9_08575 [Kiritimatiellia bacterium]
MPRRDTATTPQGTQAPKLAYWLNRRYILKILNENLKTSAR